MSHLYAIDAQKSFSEFAETTSIPISSVDKKTDSTGFHSISFGIPEGEWGDFKGQIRNTTEFLVRWERELAEFTAALAPEEFTLKFVVFSRLNEVVVQNDRLPKDLIAVAGRIGLSILFSSFSPDSVSDL